MTKQHQLAQILEEYQSVCIGYSGGVDSAFLAISALDVLGASNVLAVTGRSASYPDVQWQAARSTAAQFGLPHLEIDTDELQDANYLANPSNRCYFCKTELWSRLVPIARARGLVTIIDGANADDARDYRPGARAAQEQGVRSPLMEVGLTKAEIRSLSRARGLPTWDQPSAPCLSSRIPYGLAITPQRLQQVEAAEAVVRALDIREFRVRHHGTVARLEVALAEMPIAIDAADLLNERILDLGFARALLDVEGYRRGSLNEGVFVQLNERSSTARFASANGSADDIAILDPSVENIHEARARVAEIRQAGFRYVTFDLAHLSSRALS